MNGNFHPTARFGHRAGARSRPADGKIFTELDPVRAASLGGQGRGDISDADFDLCSRIHGVLPTAVVARAGLWFNFY